MKEVVIIIVCVIIGIVFVSMINTNEQFLSALPYCVNEFGTPIPCKIPCQDIPNGPCQWNYPVPVLSRKAGAYMPHKFSPNMR
jgi:hypothetical protein